MNQRPAARRAASALAATTLLTLGGAASALARTDGTFTAPSPQPTVSLPYSQEVYEMHYLGRGRFVNEPAPVVLPAAAGSPGYLPAGTGVLLGIALAGAGAVVVSRHRHAHTGPRGA